MRNSECTRTVTSALFIRYILLHIFYWKESKKTSIRYHMTYLMILTWTLRGIFTLTYLSSRANAIISPGIFTGASNVVNRGTESWVRNTPAGFKNLQSKYYARINEKESVIHYFFSSSAEEIGQLKRCMRWLDKGVMPDFFLFFLAVSPHCLKLVFGY